MSIEAVTRDSTWLVRSNHSLSLMVVSFLPRLGSHLSVFGGRVFALSHLAFLHEQYTNHGVIDAMLSSGVLVDQETAFRELSAHHLLFNDPCIASMGYEVDCSASLLRRAFNTGGWRTPLGAGEECGDEGQAVRGHLRAVAPHELHSV
ncbi:hypothetical protein GH5_00039 [Leishmania sp. Ghana 2012 LV757]|uniref:hypothetical protein n=1 Tax=Leishmania sp. Ghana 2012 LV757 TaxID=2803181 RepID=UPI001B41D89C|nr:hypothetical protein GH5_00039 [Leishmania sp. Ghana 2012 LV757]